MKTAHPGPEINWQHKTHILPMEVDYLFECAITHGHVNVHLNKEVQDHITPDIMVKCLHYRIQGTYKFNVISIDTLTITCQRNDPNERRCPPNVVEKAQNVPVGRQPQQKLDEILRNPPPELDDQHQFDDPHYHLPSEPNQE